MASISDITNASKLTPSATSATSSTSSTDALAGTDQFDENTFLKLLVAQLQYQDPNNPTDPTQFMSQTAQFSMVEKLTTLSSTENKLVQLNTSLQQDLQSQTAASLVGKNVTWTDAKTGLDSTGVVTAATLGANPAVTVGGQSIPIASVTAVAGSAS